jgi:peroxiredoxin Q/BCP
MNAYRDQYAQVFKNGKDVVLIGISTDADTMLASWARDSQFPFLFLSDPDGSVGRAWGATVPGRNMDARNLFIVRNGQVVERMVPFREVDPQAYVTLGAAVARLTPQDSTRN